MPRRRQRTARNLSSLALQAPFVAAHRLTHQSACNDPLKWWFGWQALAWEKWFAGAEVASAIATSAFTRSPRAGAAALEHLVDASLVPLARRVRRNAQAIRRRRI